jgi:CDGSH-type Zn-finger protein
MTMRITVTPQGPYLVAGSTPLRRKRPVRTADGEPVTWQSDEPLATEESYALCRCGGSQNKPFCDGTHNDLEWDGTTTATGSDYDERAKAYAGNDLELRDDRSLCQHAGFCATKLTNVWKMVGQTGDTAVRSQLIAMVDRCPSGALTHRLGSEGSDLEPALAAGISVLDDGPLQVTGGIAISRPDEVPVEVRNRVTLCRCGASKNKPFCDGSHSSAGFADPAG